MSTATAGPLQGRVAMVTGAAAGIGLAVAHHLAAQGAAVVLLDRDGPAAHAAAAGLPGGPDRHQALALDLVQALADPLATNALLPRVLDRHGRLDILVNNAGVALLDEAAQQSRADWNLTLALNLTAPFLLAQAVLPAMRARGWGRIVNIASQAGVVALARHAAYSASKAGLIGLTRVLALEWAPLGITVNAVSPTVVDTELGRRAWAGPAGEALRQRIPAGRFALPGEVAVLVGYLCSEAAAMVTGSNLLLDGGYTVH